MSRFFGLTGTPGTGKKTLAPLVSGLLGVPALRLNDLAKGLAGAKGDDESEVDTAKLGLAVRSRAEESALLCGHLLPYVLRRSEAKRIVVLRCDPSVLKGRLLSRGYLWPKALENVEAELIGVVSSECYEKFQDVVEYDTTRKEPAEAAKAVASLMSGNGTPAPRVEWTRDYDNARELRALLSP